MKHRFIIQNYCILCAFIFIFFTGCVKKDEIITEFFISPQTAQIGAGDSILLTININKNPQWSSSNEFVGEINENGLFIALRVGKTKIKAEYLDFSNEIEIVVLPKASDVTEPLLIFGENQEKIKELKSRTLVREIPGILTYAEDSPFVKQVIYIFNRRKYQYSIVHFKDLTKLQIEHLLMFYNEHYEFLGSRNNDLYFTDQKRNVLVAISDNENPSARYTVYEEVNTKK